MSADEKHAKKILEEFARFRMTIEELHLLKQVSNDLKSFKEMMKFKKYD